jgi:hypothetical protein
LAVLQQQQQQLLDRQQRDASLPVIVFALEDDAQATLEQFTLLAHNAGNGPALDVVIEFRESKVAYDYAKQLAPLPVALPREQQAWFNLSLNPDRPFEPAFATQAFTEPVPVLADEEQQAQAQQAHAQKRQQFDIRVRTLAETLSAAAVIVATYRDIHERVLETETELRVGKPLADQGWPHVYIGATRIKLPTTEQTLP